MKLLYVPLNSAELDSLRTLARAERRRPQDQAAVLLARALAETDGEAVTQRSTSPLTGPAAIQVMKADHGFNVGGVAKPPYGVKVPPGVPVENPDR